MSTKGDNELSTTKGANPIPEGYDSITPHLIVKICVNAIEFYKKVFGAREEYRFTMPDDNTKRQYQNYSRSNEDRKSFKNYVGR